jgi:hypothetical protein
MRGLRHRTAAARLLRLRGRIPTETCECCMLQVEVYATCRSLVQRSPTECGVSECDLTSTMRRTWPTRAVEPLQDYITAFFFKFCKSVHYRTTQINNKPDAAIFQFIILTFIYSSTCFGRFPAHHQELNDCSGSL